MIDATWMCANIMVTEPAFDELSTKVVQELNVSKVIHEISDTYYINNILQYQI